MAAAFALVSIYTSNATDSTLIRVVADNFYADVWSPKGNIRSHALDT